jgi:surfactin synthase thioesterase subunit
VLRKGSPACSAEDMTDDAIAVLDELGRDSAHLFGHSMGGQLAQRQPGIAPGAGAGHGLELTQAISGPTAPRLGRPRTAACAAWHTACSLPVSGCGDVRPSG